MTVSSGCDRGADQRDHGSVGVESEVLYCHPVYSTIMHHLTSSMRSHLLHDRQLQIQRFSAADKK